MATYLIDSAGALNGPVELPVIPGLGVQLPSNSVELPNVLPAPGEDSTWTLIDGQPRKTPDHRGTVYRIDTGVSLEWTELGALPDGYVATPWPGAHYVWLEGAWKLDVSAQLAAKALEVRDERDVLLREATLRIAPLQYAHDEGDSTEEEEVALIGWKRYSVALSRIEQQAGYPQAVDWPVQPNRAE
ncbi:MULTISPECIES: tail fiber assembly protein [unclassified Pseudomonas]|uniref:tail fiber assembly protein n=1 Tax=unclassified Pseudomonas TaxID=196821 RepID=UPI002160DE42|nr:MULTISPECIES: tail fiber assembly protein [unclassified Pseudomonas]UVM52225.1 tail fiber assembly protein [Pseudomonas sp. B21-015]WPN60435.1 tail fiber assembly protein [Pseudomonas sp. P9_31]